MKFRDPYFLFLLAPLVGVLAYQYFKMMQGSYSARVSIPWRRLWDPEREVRRFPPRFLHTLLYAAACVFLILALARPQTSFQKIKSNVQGIDIMFVLDLSASMRIEDFRDANRLEISKPIVRDFINARINDKIGFQIFSGEAVTLVPPTLDHTVLLSALDSVEIGDLKDGTAIGDALAAAVGRLKESTAKSRVIVLLTDGDSNMGSVDPLTAGELAKGFGIRVYSIAIGRDGRVQIPFVQKDIFGRKVKVYQYYDNTINPELLQKISTITNGKFYRVQDNEKHLREVFEDIDRLEKTKIEKSEQVRFEENFIPLIGLAALIFLFAFLTQNVLRRVYP